ncbi:hypothetical protein BKA62DRAFT_48226 [Auriculariales sp. MPI-PUGE-AT-0066]|nr:hypothetical protein BKA62DRAFT_48226 [Auriculariales sp. MPI-PUGE-AT-0066]
MRAAFATTLISSLVATINASPAPVVHRDTNDFYVQNIAACPALAPRVTTTKSVHDARPDDFTVFMALGDSITAGALAEGLQTNPFNILKEWRGVSYAIGGDPGAITVPNLMSHYSNTRPKGASVGSHGLQICFGPLCLPGSLGWNSKVDQFSAALTGALASNLLHEAKDYLVPQYKASGVSDSALKYMSFQIGSNDVCQLCALGGIGDGIANGFEKDVRATLEHVRKNIPNVLVNIAGVFQVSQIYPLTQGKAWCNKILPAIPHVNLECSCALLGGAAGNVTRSLMDDLADQYNTRLQKIVKEYQQMKYPGFAAVWQPIDLPLTTFPVEALSDVDCFHPSTMTHQRMAMAIYSRLTLPQTEREKSFVWQDTPTVRCLEDTDRIDTTSLL